MSVGPKAVRTNCVRYVRARVARHHLADVVLVPENQEEPDVVLRGLGRRMRSRTDRQRDVVVLIGLSVVLDELERADFLGDAVFLQLEIARGQRRHGDALAIEHGHVDADKLGTGPENGLRRLRLSLSPGAGFDRIAAPTGRPAAAPEPADSSPTRQARASNRGPPTRGTNDTRLSQSLTAPGFPCGTARSHAGDQKTIDDRNGRRYRCPSPK